MFYVKATIPTTVTTGHLFWKKTRLINKEEVGSILRHAIEYIAYTGKKIGWHRSVVFRVQETVLSGLAVRVKKWFDTEPKEGEECAPREIIAIAAISQYEEETPSFYVGVEDCEDCREFYKMCEEQRNAEIARTLEELGMKKAEKAEVKVTTPAGTFMGELDVDVAKKLEDRLGYGCEVWYKEERP